MAEEFTLEDLDELEAQIKRLSQLMDRHYAREMARYDQDMVRFDRIDQALAKLSSTMGIFPDKMEQACNQISTSGKNSSMEAVSDIVEHTVPSQPLIAEIPPLAAEIQQISEVVEENDDLDYALQDPVEITTKIVVETTESFNNRRFDVDNYLSLGYEQMTQKYVDIQEDYPRISSLILTYVYNHDWIRRLASDDGLTLGTVKLDTSFEWLSQVQDSMSFNKLLDALLHQCEFEECAFEEFVNIKIPDLYGPPDLTNFAVTAPPRPPPEPPDLRRRDLPGCTVFKHLGQNGADDHRFRRARHCRHRYLGDEDTPELGMRYSGEFFSVTKLNVSYWAFEFGLKDALFPFKDIGSFEWTMEKAYQDPNYVKYFSLRAESLKRKAPTRWELLKEVRLSFNSKKLDSLIMAWVLFGCWADFTIHNAHKLYLILASPVCQHASELRDGLGDDVETIYVGCLNEEIVPSEQDNVQYLLDTFKCVPTFLPPKLFIKFYHGFCKQHLWPLFHYMLPLSPDLGGRFDRSFWQAYVYVNKIFADKVLEVIRPDDDFIWVHDYHLMVLPKFFRKRFNRVRLGFFLHSPFLSSEIYRTLLIRDELLRSLLNPDIIEFHTFDYAMHFPICCSRMLGLSYQFNWGYIGLEYYGRTVSIKILVVAIHIGQLQSIMNLPEIESKVTELHNQFKGQTILALDPNFKKLSVARILSAYNRTKHCAILLDYDSTMVQPGSLSTTPNAAIVAILNSLCRDTKNCVFINCMKGEISLVNGDWEQDIMTLIKGVEKAHLQNSGDTTGKSFVVSKDTAAIDGDVVVSNIGDMASMSSNLFGSYFELLSADIVVAAIPSFGVNHELQEFAYGDTVLVFFVVFGTFVSQGAISLFDTQTLKGFIGLTWRAMLSYIFSAMIIKLLISVTLTMIWEARRQFNGNSTRIAWISANHIRKILDFMQHHCTNFDLEDKVTFNGGGNVMNLYVDLEQVVAKYCHVA